MSLRESKCSAGLRCMSAPRLLQTQGEEARWVDGDPRSLYLLRFAAPNLRSA
jgi:hypothetical protein